jgi:hypothetical protein
VVHCDRLWWQQQLLLFQTAGQGWAHWRVDKTESKNRMVTLNKFHFQCCKSDYDWEDLCKIALF